MEEDEKDLAEAMQALRAEHAAAQQRAIDAREQGLPALMRLIALAEGDTGGSEAARNILLSLYNGSRCPVDLYELQRLDFQNYTDAIAVIAMNTLAFDLEIHKRIPGTRDLFERWAEARESALDAKYAGKLGLR